jgi:GTP1/Obg family GTP-binding protein
MQTEEMIPASEFCVHHNIELSFLHSLNESGLIQIISIEETLYVPISQLPNLEKLVRFYYDLDINVEGIETITHLLYRINTMQQQIAQLTQRLYLYERE